MKKSKEKKREEEEIACINKVKAILESGKSVKDGDWSAKEIEVLN